jgi:hypothetical protein
VTELADDEFDDEPEDDEPDGDEDGDGTPEVSDYVAAASGAFMARLAGDSTLAAMLEAAADVAIEKTVREARLAREDRDGR